MDILEIANDIKVIGLEVKTFPEGIGEMFDALMQRIPGGFNRPYYGISSMNDSGKMVYVAVAEEQYANEAESLKLNRHYIQKGRYLTMALHDWRKNLDKIKKNIGEMLEDERADHTKPCVEWYKNDSEMVCMVKMK